MRCAVVVSSGKTRLFAARRNPAGGGGVGGLHPLRQARSSARRRRAPATRTGARIRAARFADGRRVVVPGCAASGHHLAVVVEGHRDRPPVRARCRGAARARGGIPDPCHQPADQRAEARRRGLDPRPHDRNGARCRHRTGARVRRRGAGTGRHHRPARRRPRGDSNGQSPSRPGTVSRRDRLSGRRLHHRGPQPERCRTDDVRSGQLRALPPQDLQRVLGHRRRAAAAHAVRHDPAHPCHDAGTHHRRLRRQCGGDGRGRSREFRPRCRRHLPGAPFAHAHPDEGRDPQPSNRHRPVFRRSNRRRRRDPRRGRNRTRRPTQGRPDRLHHLASAHPGPRATVGGRAGRQARSHRVRARHHDRRADRRRGVQQRVRTSQSRRLLPHLRADGRRAQARFPQADHDCRRPGQHRRRPVVQG